MSPNGASEGAIAASAASPDARLRAEEVERRHLALAMQRRYDGVVAELGSAREALERVTRERDALMASVEDGRVSGEEGKRREARAREECERATRERDEARAAKRELLDASERKDRERDALKASVDGYVAALEAAHAGKNKAEAEARRAVAEANGAVSARNKLESEVKALEEHNAWLKAELESKTSEILSATKTTSAETLRLKQEVETERSKNASQTRELVALKEHKSASEAKITALEEELRDVRVEKAKDESSFEKELAKSQRIAQVSKELVNEREMQIKELEATLRSMEAMLDAKKVEFEVALADAKHAKVRAEKELETARKQMSETTSALREPSHRSASAEQLMLLSPAAGAAALEREGMSATELYSKYVEAADALRVERMQRQELQGHLDAILADLEQKAPLIAEQKQEYERALQSHQVLQAQLRDAENARASIEAELNAMSTDRRLSERMLNGYKAQSADLARQVALLLNEVHELKGCPPIPMPVIESRGGDAQAVITSRLVDFTDIQSLQAKNQEMLFVIRDLSEAQESRSSEARDEYERKLQDLKEQTSRQLEELSNKRTQQENIVQAIVRQRDMYKTLYTAAMGGGNGDDMEVNELERKSSEIVAIGGGSTAAMMETNNELVTLNKELSHDLEKIKRDSSERIRELQRQVDDQREAAATARGEASAAKSAADFERQRFERINEQYMASQREVHALSEKNSMLTQQNAAHEAKVRAQAASLNAAEERARNAQTQIAKLESDNALLVIEQKRLSDIVSAADEIKLKLEASRDSALSLSSAREDEHKREYARLTDEVNRLQQDYNRVRSELDIERERGRQQLAAHAAASSELAQRSKSDIEAREKLKEQQAEAEKRADIAEAKLEMMEVTLMKTEEKLRLASRMTSGGELTALNVSSAGPISAAREQELLQAALKAGEAADEAKSALETEKTHTAQFKALAQQNDSALKGMTKAFEAHKTQTMKEMNALKAECTKLKKEAADAAKSVDDKLAASVKDMEAKVAQCSQLETELKSVRSELERAQGETKAAEERAAKALKDVETHHAKWREAQSQYETELAARKSDQEKIAAAEAAKAEIEKSLTAAKESAAHAERELASARAQEAAEKNELELAKRAAESKIVELTEQNTRLHNIIETSKSESAGDQIISDEGEVLRYLRQERDAALAQVAALTSERNKWQRDAEIATKEAESAKARAKASEASAMGEEKHQSLMQKVEQLNAMEQANGALRAEIEAAKADIAAAKKREVELTAKSEAAAKELAEARAAVAGHDSELEAIRKEAQRWEQRATQLVGKYSEADAEEQGRVKAQLEEELTKIKEELAAETTRADKAKSQLAISMKHIRVYNPDKVPLPEWQKTQKEQMDRLAELEAAAEAAKAGKKEEVDLEVQLASAREALEAANAKVKAAAETAEQTEKVLSEVKAEVEKLQAEKRAAEEAAKEAASKETPPEEEQETEGEEDGNGENAALAPQTPSSDRFKLMAQKMQSEAMEAAKKLRQVEETLASKESELATALKEKSEAVQKCASLQKDLDGAREKLKLAEQLREALEKKLSAVPSMAPSTAPKPAAPLSELASKAKEFVPAVKQPAVVPFAPKLHEPHKEADAEAKASKAKVAEELEKKMEAMRQELERKKAAASATGSKRKAEEAEDEPKAEVPAKSRKTETEDTPAAGKHDAAEEESDDDEDAEIEEEEEEEEEDENADETEEGELEEDADDFVEQLLVDAPAVQDAPATKSRDARGTPGRGGRGGRGERRPTSNRQRNRSRTNRGGRGKKNT